MDGRLVDGTSQRAALFTICSMRTASGLYWHGARGGAAQAGWAPPAGFPVSLRQIFGRIEIKSRLVSEFPIVLIQLVSKDHSVRSTFSVSFFLHIGKSLFEYS